MQTSAPYICPEPDETKAKNRVDRLAYTLVRDVDDGSVSLFLPMLGEAPPPGTLDSLRASLTVPSPVFLLA